MHAARPSACSSKGRALYRAERAEYTTCGPGNDDWYVRASELQHRQDARRRTARDASIVFKGVPIFSRLISPSRCTRSASPAF